MPGNKHIEDHVSVETLHDLFECDAERGVLTWKPRPATHPRINIWNARFAGKLAGRILSCGALQIVVTIEGVRFHSTAHRVVFAMTTGRWPAIENHVDHRKGERSDNSFSGIREATPTQNMRNKTIYKNNKSGFKGVRWEEREQRWAARISVNKKNIYVGYYRDVEIAARAYDAAAIKHFGEFARTNEQMGNFNAR